MTASLAEADDLVARAKKAGRILQVGHVERYNPAIEAALGREAVLNLLPMQPGDVPATEADTTVLEAATGFRPATAIETGVKRFVDWYCDYYKVSR